MKNTLITITKNEVALHHATYTYIITVHGYDVPTKKYYVDVFVAKFTITAIVKDSNGEEYDGIATWNGTDIYDEDFGVNLAILRAVLVKERSRNKKFNTQIRNKKKQIEILTKEVQQLEKYKVDNGLKEAETMYTSLISSFENKLV